MPLESQRRHSVWHATRAARIVDQWERKLALSNPERFRPGYEIFGFGTPASKIFLLTRGIAALHYVLPGESETVFLLAYPGELLNVTIPEPGSSGRTCASAVTKCELYSIDVGEVREQGKEQLLNLLNDSLYMQVARRTRALAESLTLSPGERLEKHLCELAEVMGYTSHNGRVRVPVPLKDVEFAKLLGLSDRQFKRVKKSLQDTGKLKVQNRVFMLPNC